MELSHVDQVIFLVIQWALLIVTSCLVLCCWELSFCQVWKWSRLNGSSLLS